MRKKYNQGSKLTGNEWMTTYSDTITLLLTFFVLLYSFSTLDANKFKQLAAAFQSVLTGQSGKNIMELNIKNGEVPVVGTPIEARPVKKDSNSMYNKVTTYVAQSNLKGKVEVLKDEKGVMLQLRDNVLFDIGKAEIKPESIAILNSIGKMLKSIPNNDIVVEGHTDNVPINNYKYPSNWELSTARAVNVVKYFVEKCEINPALFNAAGYGEYRPIAPNNSEANRAKNRRVNIIIIEKDVE